MNELSCALEQLHNDRKLHGLGSENPPRPGASNLQAETRSLHRDQVRRPRAPGRCLWASSRC